MTKISQLYEITKQALRAIDDPQLNEFLELLPPETCRERDLPTRTLPVCDYLLKSDLTCSATTRPVIDAFLEGVHGFAWDQTYTAEDFGEDFLQRYGWVELVGERGYYYSTKLLISFLVIGPHNTYPPHRHVADENYLPLAGNALCMKGRKNGANYILRPPGSIVHHPSRVWHSVRSDDQPLIVLAFWRWGNLTEKSDTGKP